MLHARPFTISLLLWLLPGGLMWACQICIPFPTDSLADHLLKSSATVLAREDPDAPFTLQTTTVLAGELPSTPLELFLDSQSRRILATSPEKTAICVYQSDADPPGWRRLGIDHGELKPLIEAILSESPQWERHPDERPRFFAPFLRHPDPQIATLAHLEVARAPYSEIRDLAGAIPLIEIRSYLTNIRYAEWHALYILFLAQSTDPLDHQRVIETVESNAEYSITLQTAAWATAFIEIQQSAGIDRLDELYFSNSRRTAEEVDAIHAAYSVQGSNTPGVIQDRIIESYKLVLTHYPRLAPRIVADLIKWQRPELQQQVVDLLSNPDHPFNPEESLQLRAYLRAPEPQPIASAADQSSKWSLAWIIAVLALLPYLFRRGSARSKAQS